jgi:hypothetical protein
MTQAAWSVVGKLGHAHEASAALAAAGHSRAHGDGRLARKSVASLGQTNGMLLTVSTIHDPATDLGYLLHKHPDRVQEFP